MKDELIFQQLTQIRERLSSIETLITERDKKAQHHTTTISAIVSGVITTILSFLIQGR